MSIRLFLYAQHFKQQKTCKFSQSAHDFHAMKGKMMMKIENDKREGQVFLCCTHVSLMKDAYDGENDDAHSIGRQPQSIGEVY